MTHNAAMEDYVLETRGIRKEFPGVVALQNVNLKVRRGTVHALLGENGAGKSTLIKIISGVYAPTAGQIIYNGSAVEQMTPQLAMKLKIAVVHQELNLVPHMSVAENVFVGRELKTRWGTVDFREMERRTAEILKRFRIELDPKARVADLSIANQQIVEIAKTLSMDMDFIILDEPTDVLTDKEIEKLFDIIRSLKAQGKTIIYITHRLDELSQICDEFTILRDGEYIQTGRIDEYTQRDIVKLMVGRDMGNLFPYVKASPGEEALRLEHCTRAGVVEDISFSIRKGEAVGLAGLVGSGRSELARCIFGVDRFDSGTVQIEGCPVQLNSVRKAIASGIFYTTENRKEDGMFLNTTVGFNMTISCLEDLLTNNVLSRRKEDGLTGEMHRKLDIKTPDMKTMIRNLSGGNQQKVIFARALLTHPKIVILDEPTRGIDVGAKAEIYNIINDLKAAGNAVIFISSELPELLGICDRILVMCEGRLNGEFAKEDATEAKIMQRAFGVTEG